MRNKFHGLIRPQNPESLPDVPSLQHILYVALNKQVIAQPLVHTNIEMLWPEGGKLARKVISRSKMRSTYKYPSTKMGCMVYCESNLELNVARILEATGIVVSFQEQPVKIIYSGIGSEIRNHFPDFLVVLSNGNKLLLEIKSDADAFNEDVLERTRTLHRELKRIGFIYLLISESQINAGLATLIDEVA